MPFSVCIIVSLQSFKSIASGQLTNNDKTIAMKVSPNSGIGHYPVVAIVVEYILKLRNTSRDEQTHMRRCSTKTTTIVVIV